MSEIVLQETRETIARPVESIKEVETDCKELEFLNSLPGSDSVHCNCGCQMCVEA